MYTLIEILKRKYAADSMVIFQERECPYDWRLFVVALPDRSVVNGQL